MATRESVIAANRFGLGARPFELESLSSDPRGWLREQLDEPADDPRNYERLSTSQVNFTQFRDYVERAQRNRAREEDGEDSLESLRQVIRDTMRVEAIAKAHTAINTQKPFLERLVRFWSNHFTVSGQKFQVLPLAGSYEREAIRPNVTGRFADLLRAVEQHPAMLLYLDNAQSFGPASFLARRRNRGLNENLAREILELHTLGVNGGYTQTDVTELARIITGWTVNNGNQRLTGSAGDFVFLAPAHEPGSKTLLGRRYRENGLEEGTEALDDLAAHPATARYIAFKLARHFVSDSPPPATVGRLERVFRETGGNLHEVSAALIDEEAIWWGEESKFKTPQEFVISAFRSINMVEMTPDGVIGAFALLGQQPFSPPSPAGWPDEEADWAGPDALLKRAEWAIAAGQRIGAETEPMQLAESSLGPTLSDHTRTAIRRAESRSQGIALLLASPEFLRR